MFKVNANITMKFDKRNSTDYFNQRIDEEIKKLELTKQVVSKEDNNGFITIVVKKEFYFDSFRDYVFDAEKVLKDYEDNIGCVDFKEATFDSGKIVMNQYI